MDIINNFNYIMYSSKSMNLFHINFISWFLLKSGLSFYYGINIYFIIYGFLCWSFWEYIYHRFAMHGLKHTVYYHKMHGYHHMYPSKPSHIPVFQYFLVSPVFFIASYYMNPSIVYSYSVGHLYGLYCFETMHKFIHNDTTMEQIYSKYHMHHHKNSNMAFCFTSPCFDILCGTFPSETFTYNYIALLPIPYIGFLGLSEKY